jgi:hypothetical protein
MPTTIIKTETLALIRRLCEAEIIYHETALMVQSMLEEEHKAGGMSQKRQPRTPDR